MTSILAKELRGRSITVNAIAPGPTATGLFLDGKPQEVIDRLSRLAPLEQLRPAADIADANSTWVRTAPCSWRRTLLRASLADHRPILAEGFYEHTR